MTNLVTCILYRVSGVYFPPDFAIPKLKELYLQNVAPCVNLPKTKLNILHIDRMPHVNTTRNSIFAYIEGASMTLDMLRPISSIITTMVNVSIVDMSKLYVVCVSLINSNVTEINASKWAGPISVVMMSRTKLDVYSKQNRYSVLNSEEQIVRNTDFAPTC